MTDFIFYIFVITTIFVVILNERLEEWVIGRFFRKFVEEVERIEAELNEYYALSVLAIAMNDREAYEGFQNIVSEKYWPLFFRKMLFTTSLYFLLLSPYMILTTMLIPNAFSIVLFIAIAFFTLKLGYGFVKDSLDSWRAWKEVKRGCE